MAEQFLDLFFPGASLKPWPEFFDVTKLEPPTQFEAWARRSMNNINKYFYNYILCSMAIFALFAVIFEPKLLVVSFITAAIATFIPEGVTINNEKIGFTGTRKFALISIQYLSSLWLVSSLTAFLYFMITMFLGALVHSSLF